MAGQLKISVVLVQSVAVPFRCRVEINNGSPGDTPTIRLWETAGVEPMYHDEKPVQLDGGGHGSIVFDDVKLSGPCVARLAADSTNSQIPLRMDDVHITVVP